VFALEGEKDILDNVLKPLAYDGLNEGFNEKHDD
jgi:hypothetical protein